MANVFEVNTLIAQVMLHGTNVVGNKVSDLAVVKVAVSEVFIYVVKV